MKKNVFTAFIGLVLVITLGSPQPAEATTVSIRTLAPNVTEAQGGGVINVSGRGLKSVTKIRIAGVNQAKVTRKTSTSFTFKMPKLSSTLRKYGGFAKIEYYSAGRWKLASVKILTTASRSAAFSSGGLTYNLLETSQPGYVPGVDGYSDYYPSSGANLFTAKLNVLNMQSSWVDLTCSFEVDIRVIDSTFRKFSDTGDRYTFLGNPECNHFMNPGFNEDCLFAFDIPAQFSPVAIKIQTVSWSGPTPKTYYLSFW